MQWSDQENLSHASHERWWHCISKTHAKLVFHARSRARNLKHGRRFSATIQQKRPSTIPKSRLARCLSAQSWILAQELQSNDPWEGEKTYQTKGGPKPAEILGVPAHPAILVNLGTFKQGVIGTGKRGHYERGLFAGRNSRISKISNFSRISRKWLDSPLFSTVWRFSKIL